MTFIRSDSSHNQDDVELHVSASPKVVVPKKERGAYTLIEFVVCITNHTSQAIRFNLYNTLIPELFDSNRKPQERSYYRDLYKTPCKENFPTIMSNDYRIISIIGKVIWQTKPFWKRRIFEKKYKRLNLSIPARDGGYWGFWDLDIRTYDIRFNYQNNLTSSDIYNGSRNSIGQVTNLLTGEVSTPFIPLGIEKILKVLDSPFKKHVIS